MYFFCQGSLHHGLELLKMGPAVLRLKCGTSRYKLDSYLHVHTSCILTKLWSSACTPFNLTLIFNCWHLFLAVYALINLSPDPLPPPRAKVGECGGFMVFEGTVRPWGRGISQDLLYAFIELGRGVRWGLDGNFFTVSLVSLAGSR